MFLLGKELGDRIRQVADEALHRSRGAVRFAEFIALPYFGQIILRFTLAEGDGSLAALDRWEGLLYELVGDEFLVDFMGDDYRRAGIDYADIEERYAAFAEAFADEAVPPGLYHDRLREDAAELLKTAGFFPDEKVWEIQVSEDGLLLLLLGQSNRLLREADAAGVTVAEVDERPCTGLIQAAFYAKRNHISLGRLLAGDGDFLRSP